MKYVPCFLFDGWEPKPNKFSSRFAFFIKLEGVLVPEISSLWRWPSKWVHLFLKNGTAQKPLVCLTVRTSDYLHCTFSALFPFFQIPFPKGGSSTVHSTVWEKKNSNIERKQQTQCLCTNCPSTFRNFICPCKSSAGECRLSSSCTLQGHCSSLY